MSSRDVKVGLFVAISLAVLGVVVFLIGDEAKMFSDHQVIKAAFKDVKGLSRGSPVRMGGVDIGTVDAIGYSENPKDATIYVNMSVVEPQARRIREDSIAEVKDKGLLGDKMIVITVGSDELPMIPPGGMVETKESRDIEQIISDLKNSIAGAERVIQNLETTTNAFAEEDFHHDVKVTVKHLSQIMRSLDEGEGYIPRLLHDKGEADKLSATVTKLQGSADELNRLLASSRAVVDRVRTGPGFAHEVLYEEKGSEAISQVGGAADEVRLALKGVREGKGLVHDVLYEEKTGELVDNLNRASADVAAITEDVRQGKGTVGAFLVDPSIYEDIKMLLGNVGRNRSLRALVRYSIRQDEEQDRVIDTQASSSADSTQTESAASEPESSGGQASMSTGATVP